MQKRFAQFILSAFLLASAQLAISQHHGLGRPVAIDKLPSGSLYVLDAQGEVHAVDFPGGQPVVTGSFHFNKEWASADIVSAQLNGQNVLFLAANYGQTGEISLYSVTGQLLKPSWTLPGGVSSLAYDADHSILYAASGHTPEIMRIDVNGNTGPELLARTPGSQRLGPILFDAKHNALLAEDLVLGAIYKVDISQRKATFLCGGLRSASAMRFSADGSLLFVSDDVSEDVLTFSMAQPKSAPRIFAKLPQFSSPSGLAWAGDRLVVSDDGARKLFFLSRSGSLVDTLPK